MLSNNNIKFVNSLQLKKQRDKNGLYVIEGDKMVREYLLSGEEVVWLFAKPEWIASLDGDMTARVQNVIPVSYDELKKISTLKTPHNSLAVVSVRRYDLSVGDLAGQLTIALDNIQDPGNLGTIIRLAGWFGINNIVCSPGCVDIYNSKVMQATMGSLLHVRVHYSELTPFLEEAAVYKIPVYGALLDGDSIYDTELADSAIILFGNESKGITDELRSLVGRPVTIPSFGKRGAGIDSLNVGMSVAVICSEFRRGLIHGQ